MDMKRVTRALTTWVTIGDLHYVDDEFFVRRTKGDEIVQIDYTNKEKRPLKVFNEDMNTEGSIIFNPYLETIRDIDDLKKENEWFYETISGIFGIVVKAIVEDVIRTSLSSDKEDDNINKLALCSEFADRINKKTLKDFLIIGKSFNFIDIFYNRKNKTSQIRCAILEPEFAKALGTKISVKSWGVFRELIQTILESSDIKEDYKFEATAFIKCPRCESFLKVVVALAEVLEDNYKIFVGREFKLNDMQEYLSTVKEDSKVRNGYVVSSKSKIKTKDVFEINKRPIEKFNIRGSKSNTYEAPVRKSITDYI